MRITISTFGSRGDVESPLALAVGLQKRGHQVTLVAPEAYAAWIRSYGVRWAVLRFDLSRCLADEALSALLRRGRRLQYLRTLRTAVQVGSREALDDLLAASGDADFILQCGVGHGGVEIADHRGIPMAFMYLYPYAPTRAFPSFMLDRRGSLGGCYNRWTQRLVYGVTWRTYGPPLNAWRSERFGLPPWSSYAQMLTAREPLSAPNLLAFSDALVPKPADWNDNQHITGFMALPPPPDWAPPAPLTRFLDSGPTPVYVGFGSMRAGVPERQTRCVLRALEAAGQRGILLVGGGGALTRLPAPDSVLYVDSVPHRWLFPRVAAAVLHGGPGTLAAALHAGLPTVTFPHMIDQHAWAQRVSELGIGINVAPLRKLRAEPLAAAIRTVVEDPALRARATAFGETIRSEDGVNNAAVLIERYAAEFPRLSNRRSAA